MYVQEFQIESPTRGSALNLLAHRRSHTITDHTAHTRLEALLLGLRLRHWLTDSDKELLDQLVHEHDILFLIHHETYLHPEGFSLFPLEAIETGLSNDGDAVFTQRYQARNGSNGHVYRIHTARIGALDDRTLILGLITPERYTQTGEEDLEFMHLVRRFRDADYCAQVVCAELDCRLASGEPSLLVNRCSGRVVVANQHMLEIIGRDARDVVDQEYGVLKNLLTGKARGRKLSMTTLSRSQLNLCLLTLTGGSTNGMRAAEKPVGITPGFLTGMQNTVASIVACGRQLEPLIGHHAGHPAYELLRLILEESADLSKQIGRLHLLAHATEYPTVPVDVLAALRTAVERVSCRRPDCTLTLVSTLDTVPPSSLPRTAPAYLFEALLNAHVTAAGAASQTTVTTAIDADGGGLRVHCRTNAGKATVPGNAGPDWLNYADHLAAALSMTLSSTHRASDGGLDTELVFPLTRMVSHEQIA